MYVKVWKCGGGMDGPTTQAPYRYFFGYLLYVYTRVLDNIPTQPHRPTRMPHQTPNQQNQTRPLYYNKVNQPFPEPQTQKIKQLQVVPAIVGECAHLTLFQRTPPYVMRKNDYPLPGARPVHYCLCTSTSA